MNTTLRGRTALGAALLAAVLAVGCSESLSLEATGEVQVLLGRQSGTPTAAVAYFAFDGMLYPIPQDTVASLTVTVTSIQFLGAGDEESDEGGWVTLDLAAPVELDLMALPSEGDSPIVIASGSVAVGAYAKVRLFVTAPTIVLKGDFSFGGTTLEGGVELAAEIPSSAQSGLKTDASFEVAEGATADVDLLFDAGTTLTNITLTGDGRVIVAPVLRSR